MYRIPAAAEQEGIAEGVLCLCYENHSDDWEYLTALFPLDGPVFFSWSTDSNHDGDWQTRYPSPVFIERMSALDIPVKVHTDESLAGIDPLTGQQRNVLWIASMWKTSPRTADIEFCLGLADVNDHIYFIGEVERQHNKWKLKSFGPAYSPPQPDQPKP
ncbi:MAG: hypothetical protein HY300_06185 [Verrucomicrobia bacterium]|nr:hypothetical protein [Verrucomicrobiota bacterium]